MARLKNVTLTQSGFLKVSTGGTGTRPADAEGRLRYNTDTNLLEIYDSEWDKPNKKENYVVTNNLVFFYDALNPKSYPGTGNTWFDLSGNGNNASLSNFSVQSDGSFRFNNGQATSPSFSSGSELTLEVTFLSTTTDTFTQYGRIIDYGDNTLSLGTASDYRIRSWVNVGGGRASEITQDNFGRDGKWKHVVMTFADSRARTYINGVLIGQSTRAGTPGITETITIGNGDAQPFRGKISEAKYYDRALTEAEVIQNFNYHKEQLGTKPYFGSGLSSDDPAPTPRAIKVNNPSAANGYYYVNPRFAGSAVRCYCDVEGSNEGGLGEGWIRVRYADNYYSRSSPWAGTGNSSRGSPPFSVPFSFDIPDADVLTLADNADVVIQRFETWGSGSVGWTYDNAFQSHEDLKGRLWSSQASAGTGTHMTQISTMEWNVGYGYSATYDSPDGRGVDPTDDNSASRWQNGTFYFKDTSGDAILPIKRIANSDVDGSGEQRFFPLLTGDMGDGTSSNIPSYIFIQV